MYAERAIKVLFKRVILVSELFIVYYFAIRSNANIHFIQFIALYIYIYCNIIYNFIRVGTNTVTPTHKHKFTCHLPTQLILYHR